jgi:DNA repair protein RadA/Sms
MPFLCSECGYRSIKWLGRCPSCGAWDSLSEHASSDDEPAVATSWLGEELRSIDQVDLTDVDRLATGMGEFDRLLGGGLIPDGVVLFGGEPGIGKSTLLLQIAELIAHRYGSVLYVSGEESEGQVKLRANRIGVEDERLYVLSEQSLSRITAAIERVSPVALIVDSIQTTVDERAAGEAGSLRQLRETSSELIRQAKSRRMATFLVGHITKEGAFAGPKSVEHLVDAAVYLEGSRGEDVRILRSVKNRFGATNEVVVFRMTAEGLTEIADPSRFFLADLDEEPRPGTTVVPILEGTRPILVEMQALVSPTGGYGVPQRRCTGLDVNRVLLLLAVMEKHLGIQVGGADVYLSLAGGLETRERGTDLGVVASVCSSLRDRPLPARTAIVGEVGLSGEIRPVRRLGERIREAEKMGMERIVAPNPPRSVVRGAIDVVSVERIGEAVDSIGLT